MVLMVVLTVGFYSFFLMTEEYFFRFRVSSFIFLEVDSFEGLDLDDNRMLVRMNLQLFSSVS